MARSILRSPAFWIASIFAVGAGVVLYQKRRTLSGATGPEPVLVKRNPAKLLKASAVRTEGGMTLTRYDASSISIDERLKLIQQRVWDGVNDPRIRKLAGQITQGCGRDDGNCEAKKIFDTVKGRVRYTGDVGPVKNPKTGAVEAIDYYQSPWRTWELQIADCDDHVGLVSALLAVIGHTVKLRVTAPTRTSEWAHIYPVSILPKEAPSKAIAVDVTLPGVGRIGREAKYAKARDYLVEVPA